MNFGDFLVINIELRLIFYSLFWVLSVLCIVILTIFWQWTKAEWNFQLKIIISIKFKINI